MKDFVKGVGFTFAVIGGYIVIVLAIVAGLGAALPAAQAAPSVTDEVCGAFNMGVPPDQIISGLQRNDGRFNYWRAQRDTVWPIIQGECEMAPG